MDLNCVSLNTFLHNHTVTIGIKLGNYKTVIPKVKFLASVDHFGTFLSFSIDVKHLMHDHGDKNVHCDYVIGVS